MEEILKMSTQEKLILLNEILKNYSTYKRGWNSEKVEWLRNQVAMEVDYIGAMLKLD